MIEAAPTVPPDRRRGRRRALVAGGTAAVLLAVAGIGAFVLLDREPSTASLVDTILTSSDQQKRADAARELADRADAEAIDRLAESAESPAALRGLALVRDGLTSSYASADARSNPDRRQTLLEALAAVDDPVAGRTLADALVLDEDSSVRSAAARGLAGLDAGAPAAAEQLISRRTESSADAVDRGLVAIGEPAVERLVVRVATQPWARDLIVKIGPGAVEPLGALAARGDAGELWGVAQTLLEIERAHPRAGTSAWQELVRRSQALITSERIGRSVILAEVLGLVERARPGLAPPAAKKLVRVLMPRVGMFNPAQDALVLLGGPAVPALVDVARDDPTFRPREVQVRIEQARFTLIRMIGENPKAIAPLLKPLRSRNHRLVADLMHFYLQLGEPGSEGVLIEALDRHGNPQMVLEFLLSGNHKLAAGARAWAARNGYTITGSAGGPPSWGTARAPR